MVLSNLTIIIIRRVIFTLFEKIIDNNQTLSNKIIFYELKLCSLETLTETQRELQYSMNDIAFIMRLNFLLRKKK